MRLRHLRRDGTQFRTPHLRPQGTPPEHRGAAPDPACPPRSRLLPRLALTGPTSAITPGPPHRPSRRPDIADPPSSRWRPGRPVEYPAVTRPGRHRSPPVDIRGGHLPYAPPVVASRRRRRRSPPVGISAGRLRYAPPAVTSRRRLRRSPSVPAAGGRLP